MEFSDKELALIARAKKKSFDAMAMRMLVIVAMVIGIALMFADVIGTERIVYGLVAAVFISVALPQFGDGPKYEELVTLLESKTRRDARSK